MIDPPTVEIINDDRRPQLPPLITKRDIAFLLIGTMIGASIVLLLGGHVILAWIGLFGAVASYALTFLVEPL